MFWVQAALSFLCWVALGVWQARRAASVYRTVGGYSRAVRVVGGVSILLAALILLFSGLGLVARSGSFGADRLSPFGWAVVTLCGLAFVQLQTYAMAMFGTLAREAAVTAHQAPASTSQDNPRI